MNCYICNTEMMPCVLNYDGKEIMAMKCPVCNDDYTTLIDAKDLKELEKYCTVQE